MSAAAMIQGDYFPVILAPLIGAHTKHGPQFALERDEESAGSAGVAVCRLGRHGLRPVRPVVPPFRCFLTRSSSHNMPASEHKLTDRRKNILLRRIWAGLPLITSSLITIRRVPCPRLHPGIILISAQNISR